MTFWANGDEVIELIGLQIMIIFAHDIAEFAKWDFVMHIVLPLGHILGAGFGFATHGTLIAITSAGGVALLLPIWAIVIGQFDHAFFR